MRGFLRKLTAYVIITALTVPLITHKLPAQIVQAADDYSVTFEIKAFPRGTVDFVNLYMDRLALINEEGKIALADTNMNLLSEYKYNDIYECYADNCAAIFKTDDRYVSVDLYGNEIISGEYPVYIYTNDNMTSKLQLKELYNRGTPIDTADASTSLHVDGINIFEDDYYLVKPFEMTFAGLRAYVSYRDYDAQKDLIYGVEINGEKTLVFEYNYKAAENNGVWTYGARQRISGDFITFTPLMVFDYDTPCESYIYRMNAETSVYMTDSREPSILKCDDDKYSKDGLFCVNSIIYGYEPENSTFRAFFPDRIDVEGVSNLGGLGGELPYYDKRAVSDGVFLFKADAWYSPYRPYTLAHIYGDTVKIVKELGEYTYVSTDLSEKYIQVKKGEMWGYINKDGEEKKFYDCASGFVNEIALVRDNDGLYFINSDLKQISERFHIEGVTEVEALSKSAFALRTEEGFMAVSIKTEADITLNISDIDTGEVIETAQLVIFDDSTRTIDVSGGTYTLPIGDIKDKPITIKSELYYDYNYVMTGISDEGGIYPIRLTPIPFEVRAGSYIKEELELLYSPTIGLIEYHIYSGFNVSYDIESHKFSKTKGDSIYLLSGDYKLVSNVDSLTKLTYLHNAQTTWYNYSTIAFEDILENLKELDEAYKKVESGLKWLEGLNHAGKVLDFVSSFGKAFVSLDIAEIIECYQDIAIKNITDEMTDEMKGIVISDSEETRRLIHELTLNLNQKAIDDYERSLKILNRRTYTDNDYLLNYDDAVVLGRANSVYGAYLAAAKADLRCMELSLQKEYFNLLTSRVTAITDILIPDGAKAFKTASEVLSGAATVAATTHDWLTAMDDARVNSAMREMFGHQAMIIDELYIALEDIAFSNLILLSMGNVTP